MTSPTNFLAVLSLLAAQVRIHSAILHGVNSDVGQFPFVASLRSKFNRHVCAGSILNPTTVLTTAHCLLILLDVEDGILVVVGTNELVRGGVAHKVSRIFHTDNFTTDYKRADNDVGIAKVKDPFRFGNLVSSVRISSRTPRDDDLLTAVGWGYVTMSPPKMSNYLKYLKVANYNVKLCAVTTNATEKNVCTVGLRLGDGFCMGDSGGPLLNADGELVGIISWTSETDEAVCGTGLPDVYMSAIYYRDWIVAHL